MIRIPFFTPTSPLEEQHTRHLFELLTQAVLGPLLMVIGAGIMLKSSPSGGLAVVTWTAFGTYLGALRPR